MPAAAAAATRAGYSPGEAAQRSQRRIGHDRSARRLRQRDGVEIDLGAGARGLQQLGEVADQPVGHIHRRGGMGLQPGGETQPRLRMEIAIRQRRAMPLRQPCHPGRSGRAMDLQAERAVADRARDGEDIARLCAGTQHHAAGRHAAESGDRERQRSRRRDGVPPDQRTACLIGRLFQPGGEGGEPAVGPALRQGERQHEAFRHRQRLAGDRARRIIGEEMHAGDQRIGGDDDLVAPRRPQQPGIIDQAEPARPRDRGEMAGDQLEFAGAFAGFHRHPQAFPSLRGAKRRSNPGALVPCLLWIASLRSQ